MPRSSALPASPNPASSLLPYYRDVLEGQWHHQVAQIIELSYAASSPSPGEADDEETTSLRLRTLPIAAARQQLEEIEAALARVDDGSYGLCLVCSRPITPEHLAVSATAKLCGDCRAGGTTRR